MKPDINPRPSKHPAPEKTDSAVAASAGMDLEQNIDFETEAASAEIEDERARAADDEFAEDLSTDLPDEEEGPARTRVDARH
ncbi:MAG: hypothetical protein KF681_01295 [Bdellovibrionaceae bacterium]|nr:hypothetical protein [Pseudobdellovibrionaceae bacterium]